MMFLVSKFSGILKKYARKLNYEDAEQDLTADFIELIHHIDIEKLNNTSDGAIVNFLIRSTYHYYVKRLQKERDRKALPHKDINRIPFMSKARGHQKIW